MKASDMQPSAVVIGVGAEDGLGAALARRFAKGGFHVLVAGRTAAKVERVAASLGAGNGTPFAMDATREAEVGHLFRLAAAPGAGKAPASVVIFNAGNNQHIPFLELSAAQFEAFWRVGCLAGFLAGREAARLLLPQRHGTILFTGASASLRGRPGFVQFSAAKAGLRMLSQSMARELGPHGIHVAHVLIDGRINSKRLQAESAHSVDAAGLLDAEAIAEAYWQLHVQHPSAWTQELDLRPFKEPF